MLIPRLIGGPIERRGKDGSGSLGEPGRSLLRAAVGCSGESFDRRARLGSRDMSRLVFCDLCDANLGVLFEREGDSDAPTLDFLPHDNCWHVSRQQLVGDLDALNSGESSLPVSLRRIPAGARQLSV